MIDETSRLTVKPQGPRKRPTKDELDLLEKMERLQAGLARPFIARNIAPPKRHTAQPLAKQPSGVSSVSSSTTGGSRAGSQGPSHLTPSSTLGGQEPSRAKQKTKRKTVDEPAEREAKKKRAELVREKEEEEERHRAEERRVIAELAEAKRLEDIRLAAEAAEMATRREELAEQERQASRRAVSMAADEVRGHDDLDFLPGVNNDGSDIEDDEDEDEGEDEEDANLLDYNPAHRPSSEQGQSRPESDGGRDWDDHDTSAAGDMELQSGPLYQSEGTKVSRSTYLTEKKVIKVKREDQKQVIADKYTNKRIAQGVYVELWASVRSNLLARYLEEGNLFPDSDELDDLIGRAWNDADPDGTDNRGEVEHNKLRQHFYSIRTTMIKEIAGAVERSYDMRSITREWVNEYASFSATNEFCHLSFHNYDPSEDRHSLQHIGIKNCFFVLLHRNWKGHRFPRLALDDSFRERLPAGLLLFTLVGIYHHLHRIADASDTQAGTKVSRNFSLENYKEVETELQGITVGYAGEPVEDQENRSGKVGSVLADLHKDIVAPSLTPKGGPAQKRRGTVLSSSPLKKDVDRTALLRGSL